MKHIFIMGSKGIPAKYGGFETFVHKLTQKKKSDEIHYYVTCMAEENSQFIFNDTVCFNVKTINIGSAKAILYDLLSLHKCINYIKDNNLKDCIIYILACRIGPFLRLYNKKLKKYGIELYVNPDGYEWKRGKWNRLIRKYWKISEKYMIKHADVVICDSKGIEDYIKSTYKKYKPKTIFIAYGADINRSTLIDNSEELTRWFDKYSIAPNEYYLIVGRFVPENNYETIIREFMLSNSEKDLVIISNLEKNKFFLKLSSNTKFEHDKRVKFVGTLYNEELLKKIRENAFAYIHGHEVGGTNPSLLEALITTKINILLDVIFNKEVAKDAAIYFNKSKSSLANIINDTEKLSSKEIENLEKKAKERICKEYSWEKIVFEYEKVFIGE